MRKKVISNQWSVTSSYFLGKNCVQLVGAGREKQWDIYPQKCSYAGISGSHRQTLPSCTQDYPKFTRIVSALFYTPILRKLTDIIRTFSTLSTPPTITTTIYI